MDRVDLNHQVLAMQLRERLKEMSCLERITALLANTDIALDELLRQVATILPPAWQYPDSACARITLDTHEFNGPDFQESPWRLSEKIFVNSAEAGCIDIYYKQQHPAADEGPFLKEERKLLQQVSLRLTQAIEKIRALEELYESDQQLRFALEAADTAAWSVDLRTGEHWRTELHDRLFGYDSTQTNWSQEIFFEHLLPEDREKIRHSMTTSMTDAETWEYNFRIRRCDGEMRWLSTRGRTLLDDKNQPTKLFGIMRDITEQQVNAERVQLAFDAMDSIGEGLMILDRHGRVVMVNQAYCRLTQYPMEKLIGVIPKADLADPDRTVFESINAPELQKNSMHGEGQIRRADGTSFPALSSISTVRDSSGEITHYTVVIRDITDYKLVEERLQHQSEHDSLTGLPNRVLLKDRVQASLIRARRDSRHLAVMFLDLDHFKNVNDSLGYKSGDQLIIKVAEVLRSALRPTDTVARTGGDQFTLLVDELASPEDSSSIAAGLVRALGRPIALAGQEIRITCSIGIACFPLDGQDFETLMHHAEQAKYEAKAVGRNNFQFFTKSINRDALRALTLQSALHKALAKNELQLYFQPFVNIATGRITGMEALLRWYSPELGFVSPVELIPLAEETGQIIEIGHWVQDEAIRQLARFTRHGHSGLRVAINLSGRQFQQPGLVASLKDSLQRERLSPSQLDVELTESLMMERVGNTMEALNALHELGVTVTIDDFGTGYSSLRYLKDFRVDYLKIDKSFIAGIPHDSGDAAIVRTVLAISRSMNIKVIAEGVENARQLNALRKWGCDEAQGYFLSKPIPADAFLQMLDHDHTLC